MVRKIYIKKNKIVKTIIWFNLFVLYSLNNLFELCSSSVPQSQLSIPLHSHNSCANMYMLELPPVCHPRHLCHLTRPNSITRKSHPLSLNSRMYWKWLWPFPLCMYSFQILRDHTCSPLRISSLSSIFHSLQGLYQCSAPSSPHSLSPIYIFCHLSFSI